MLGAMGGKTGAGKERSSFLKKRSKKLLERCRGLAGSVRKCQKFFASFFQKRRPSFLPPPERARTPKALAPLNARRACQNSKPGHPSAR
jgi:hypothetical protein